MKNVRRVLRVALMLGLFGAMLLVAVPAGAQAPQCPPGPYPPRTSDLQVDRTVVERGGTLRAASCGWQASSTVTVTLECPSYVVVLGNATADSGGNWNGTFTIPTSAPPGECRVFARGFGSNGGPLVLSAAIRVTDPVAQAGTQQAGITRPAARTTPRTGADVAPWLILAVAVLGAGLVLLKIGRRKKGDLPA